MKDEIIITTISDLHWGAPRIDNDKLYNELDKIFFKTLKKRKPDMIVIVGDLMDRKVSMNSDETSYANRFIHRLVVEFPDTYILLIHGTLSHDYMQLDAYKHYTGQKFRIYKTVTPDYIESLKLLIIPEEYYSDKSVYDKFLKLPKGDKKYDFVFIHGTFSHAGFSYSEHSKRNKIVFDYKDFSDNVYGRVNCGHIHTSSEYKNIDYNGSFSRWSHGEEDPKGFYIYTYNTKSRKLLNKEFIENTLAPTYKTIFYEHLPTDPKELYKLIKDYSDNVESLRINLSSQFKIPEKEMIQIVDIAKQFDNVVLLKSKLAINIDDSNEEYIEELQEKLTKYHDKTFEEMTIMFAKEELDKDITKDHIVDALS